MKLGDIYVNKNDESLIQIDSFATFMGDFLDESIVIFRQLDRHNEFEIGSCPSFNGYGSKEDIEENYDLLIPQEKLREYNDWNAIFELAQNRKRQ